MNVGRKAFPKSLLCSFSTNVQVTDFTPAQGPNDGPMVHVYPSVETSETTWPPKATISQRTLKDVSEKW